jgi:hypothetical protein
MTKLEEIISKLPTYTDEGGYGKHYVIQAMKEYAEFCCEKQKKICAKYIDPYEYSFNDEGHITGEVENKSIKLILNSPTYKEENGK